MDHGCKSHCHGLNKRWKYAVSEKEREKEKWRECKRKKMHECEGEKENDKVRENGFQYASSYKWERRNKLLSSSNNYSYWEKNNEKSA